MSHRRSPPPLPTPRPAEPVTEHEGETLGPPFFPAAPGGVWPPGIDGEAEPLRPIAAGALGLVLTAALFALLLAAAQGCAVRPAPAPAPVALWAPHPPEDCGRWP